MKLVGWLLVIGGTAGPVLDGLHTFSGAIWYAEPQFLRSVWWCPPLFAGAAVAIGGGRVFTERVLSTVRPPPPGRSVVFTMTAFVVAYALSGLLPASEVTVAVVIACIFVVAWAGFDRSLLALVLALLTGLGGWFVEHTLVGLGLFFHRSVILDGIALWIPPLYFVAAIAVGTLGRWLAARQ